MKIGVDIVALQSWDRHRGIGRYGRELLSNMIALDSDNEYLLYVHDSLPDDLVPVAANARPLRLRIDHDRGDRQLGDVVDRLARENPDDLDVLLLLSPFDQYPGYAPPAKPLNSLKLAAVVYDMIPFLYQEQYLTDPSYSRHMYRSLERLRRYDLLLTISESTRDDLHKYLRLSPGKVVTILGAADSAFFTPRIGPPTSDSKAVLEQLGVLRPFVFSVSGIDELFDRKNLRGLIDAFGLLPAELRESHDLVVSCCVTPEAAARTRDYARSRGVEEHLILTGSVSDEALRTLYRECSAFAFPSKYEGLGLPMLEAMHCGAAVAAGNNSSQVEVLGDAGLLVNTADPSDLAEKLARILLEPVLSDDLRRKAVERSRRFTWRATANRAIDAINALGHSPATSRERSVGRPTPRPKLAVFSPFPPKKSGISDYIHNLIGRLRRTYSIDLYHESGYLPDPATASPDFASYDHRLFERNDRVLGYRGVLYQMGNSEYHRFVYQSMLRRPGVTTLHDYCLSGFHTWYDAVGGAPTGHLRRELERAHPDVADEALSRLSEWAAEPGGLQEALANRGLHLNRSVLECSKAVVVHSSWCLSQIRSNFPEHESKAVLIPHGAEPSPVSAERRASTRARFGLPRDALIFASFGILHMNKLNVETIRAFHAAIADRPGALLLFVGQDLGFGEARAAAEELDLRDRVRFLGRQTIDDFNDLIASVDVGVSLRRPPTNGETSGALLGLLRMGVPAIVADVGTFSGYPGTAVRKVNWESEGTTGLARAMRDMAEDPAGREALGRAALQLVEDVHDWSIVASMYTDVIERTFKEDRAGPPTPASSPRFATRRAVTC